MQLIGMLARAQRSPAAWFGAAGVRRRLRDGRRGTAAIEFALLFPVMVALMFGMTDACAALVAYRRVTLSAEEIGLIASELSVQSDGSTSLTTTQMFQAASAIFGVIPNLESAGSGQPFAVTVSEIVFIGSPSGCSGTACTSYTANIAWSVPLASFTSMVPTGTYLGITNPRMPVRNCGTVSQVAQSTTPTYTTIQTSGMTNLSSMLVVDVQYLYKPLFTQVFVGSVTFMHTYIESSRTTPPSGDAQYIAYDLANDGTDTYICAGYT